MREIEQQMIDLIGELYALSCSLHDYKVYRSIRDRYNALLQQAMAQPFGLTSIQFIQHHNIRRYVADHPLRHDLFYWFHIETYFSVLHDHELAFKNIILIAQHLHFVESTTRALDERQYLNSPQFVSRVYATQCAALIQLFELFYPAPRASIFTEMEMPPAIAERECDETKVILKILSHRTIEAVEKPIISAQRLFRAKMRHREEIKRIEALYLDDICRRYPVKSTEQVMALTNKPYRPRYCDAALADRMEAASKKIKLFFSIRHCTSKYALKSILDDGLYGRRTLEKLHMRYRSAALKACDIADGDYNVICFGPQEIDPQSSSCPDNIDIVLNLDKMQLDNPCIFYKQRDFGFVLKEIYEVALGGSQLHFTHTYPDAVESMSVRTNYTYLTLLSVDMIMSIDAELPKFLFMADDVKNIHQILILNFFRFIDELYERDYNPHPAFVKSLYQHIAQLSDGQLDEFLTRLGHAMTNTAEFNIYGAYRIDFAALSSFHIAHYELNLPLFIEQLQTGERGALEEVKTNIPQLFTSYRFIDYLRSRVSRVELNAELYRLRTACILPFWREMKERNIQPNDDIATQQAAHHQQAVQFRI
ncbi:MAG: hypothetical protein ACD_45C00528G0003 [uncultured bacterium]|nr:MAG: hypothetical protein ACD_45C00528G0003 [uncultured bacterium]